MYVFPSLSLSIFLSVSLSLCVSQSFCSVIVFSQSFLHLSSVSISALAPRLNKEEGDGAWCPAGPLEPTDVQYLQLDLRQLTFLTVVGTQGRYARSSNEFARMYRLDYSRDGHHCISWKSRLGNKV